MLKAVKRVPLRPDTFKELKIFCAKNSFNTYDEAVKHLLKPKRDKTKRNR